MPVAGLQIPCWWQAPGTGQMTALPPAQTPPWQTSVWVQALPSLQALPESSLQVPLTSAPAATEQASQTPPLQDALQQTPSAQKPLRQSVPAPHAVPRAPAPPKSSALARGAFA